MKNILLYSLFLIGLSSLHANDNNTSPLNDELFSFEIEPTATSEFIDIVTNNKYQVITIKIIDKSGFIRIERKLHLDRTIDVSALREGFYLIKVYSENHTAIKRFYKGQDNITKK